MIFKVYRKELVGPVSV